MSIDDRIYRLQKSYIPSELLSLLRRADTLFLTNEVESAGELVTYLETECERRGVALYWDDYMETN